MDDYSKRLPEIHPEAFVADGARLVGRVVLAEGASVWYNAVLRADIADIIVGADTNLQDGSLVHVDHGVPTVLGRGVTVGHGAILHACTVGDNVIIGMGSIVLDGAVVPPDAIVAAGALIPPRKTYAPGSLLVGSPAVVARKLSEAEVAQIRDSARHYRELWQACVLRGIGSYSK
ncbi:MAG: gamma carbonic anhydrase family protein [Candidatus Aminicenantes bacterium]|nr:gamma carbonic anhydrase family protein [Candidatus Aminicenantes bacterium]